MVNLNKSEYILELMGDSNLKLNWKLIRLIDTIIFCHITMRKDADILKVTVANVLYKYLTTQMLLSRYNIL